MGVLMNYILEQEQKCEEIISIKYILYDLVLFWAMLV